MSLLPLPGDEQHFGDVEADAGVLRVDFQSFAEGLHGLVEGAHLHVAGAPQIQ